MTDLPWQQRGPWRFLIAPGRDRPGFDETLSRLPFLIEKKSSPLVPPGRHRVDRLALPCAAVRRGWLLPDDGPDGGRAA